MGRHTEQAKVPVSLLESSADSPNGIAMLRQLIDFPSGQCQNSARPRKELLVPRSRKPSNLHATTNHRLSAYSLAASAAGVSLLALAPCDAQIVYTPAHVTIGRGGSYGLDLTNDGKIEFTIFERVGDRGFGTYQELNIIAAQGNKIECSGGGGPSCAFTVTYAAALVAGARIGEGPRYFHPYGAPMAGRFTSRGNVFYSGRWSNVRDRYLGLRFHLNDGPHFGWARLSVEFVKGSREPSWRAQITGYAYETAPNTSIIAGQTGADEASAQPDLPNPVQFSALGALALGSDGIALWRSEVEK
jgi:hypothetical protein